MEEIKISIEELESRLNICLVKFGVDGKRKKIVDLELQSATPGFWDDPQHAGKLMEELVRTKEEIGTIEALQRRIDDVNAMKELGMNEEFEKERDSIEKDLVKLEFKTFLSGSHDESNAIVTIRAGQGGTEAMDWAEILLRMYVRYAERMGWKSEVVDQARGDEAGIKSATIQIAGSYSFGYLKGEDGVHRLVRQSPFNADKLRQTSFAEVEVIPQIEEVSEVDIKDDDLEWDFFRASSHGGQNVQKVSTAVRVVHKPTGITITSQTERFQEQNRKIAMDLLRSKLWDLSRREKEQEKKDLQGEHKIAGWGNQIRSYVLHPYKMVKDLRTEVESSNPDNVLDGDLDMFIEAELKAGV